jgi:hypothetical protein
MHLVERANCRERLEAEVDLHAVAAVGLLPIEAAKF